MPLIVARATSHDPAASRWSGVRDVAGQASWLAAGKGTLIAVNIVLQVFLAQRLPLDSYGILITLIGAQIFLSRVLLAGSNTGMIRLRTTPEFRSRPQDVVVAGLGVVLVNSVLLIGLGLLLRPLVTHWLRWPGWALDSLVGGSIGMALVDYAYAHHLARLQYRGAALSQALPALLRLALTVGAAFASGGDRRAIFFAYAGSTLLGGAVQVPSLLKGKWGIANAGRLLRYSLYCAGTDILATLSYQEGTFLVSLAGFAAGAGTYGFALTISLGVSVLYSATIDYLLPRAARVEDFRHLAPFTRRTAAVTSALALICAAGMPVVGWLVHRFFQPHLWPSVPIFYVLGGSMLLLILQTPLEMACQYMLRADLIVASWLVRVLAIGGLGFALLSGSNESQAAWRMATAQLAGGVCSLVVLGVLTWIAWRRFAHASSVGGRQRLYRPDRERQLADALSAGPRPSA